MGSLRECGAELGAGAPVRPRPGEAPDLSVFSSVLPG